MPVTTGLCLYLVVAEENVFSHDFKEFVGKVQNEVPVLKAGSCIFSPASLDKSEGISDFTSVLPGGRILNILYHIFAHYLLFKILRAVYVLTCTHTHITVVICK